MYILVLFMGLIELFQLTFSFIYSTFNKKVFQFQLNKLYVSKRNHNVQDQSVKIYLKTTLC